MSLLSKVTIEEKKLRLCEIEAVSSLQKEVFEGHLEKFFFESLKRKEMFLESVCRLRRASHYRENFEGNFQVTNRENF